MDDDDDTDFGDLIRSGKALLYSIGKREAYRGSNRGRDGDGTTIMAFFRGNIRFVNVVANWGVDAVEEEDAYVDATVAGVNVEDDDDDTTLLFLFIGVICFGVPWSYCCSGSESVQIISIEVSMILLSSLSHKARSFY